MGLKDLRFEELRCTICLSLGSDRILNTSDNRVHRKSLNRKSSSQVPDLIY